jgi:hypothetical protein
MPPSTHVGSSPTPTLFATAEPGVQIDQPATRKRGGGKAKVRPAAVESETTHTIYELYEDGTAGGEKLPNNSDEHCAAMAAEYLAIAQRKVEFYTEWLKRHRADKRRPWRSHV